MADWHFRFAFAGLAGAVTQRVERHSDSNFSGALRYAAGGQVTNSDRRKDDGDTAKYAEHILVVLLGRREIIAIRRSIFIAQHAVRRQAAIATPANTTATKINVIRSSGLIW